MVGQGKETSAERRKQRAEEARAAAAAAARKRRMRVLGGTAAVLLLVGAMAGAAVGARALLGDDDSQVAAQPTIDPSESPSSTATPTPAAAGKANCVYLEDPAGSAGKQVGTPPQLADAEDPSYATLEVNGDPVVIELNAMDAPCTVNSFVHLAKSGFYDDTPCHRELNQKGDPDEGTLDAYVLQCGDPTGSGGGGPGYSFADENLAGATYEAGVVAMANAGANTNGSQFFMMFDESSFPPAYVPFGKIISGLDVLTDIAKKGVTGPNNDEPKVDVTIDKVTISSTKPKA